MLGTILLVFAFVMWCLAAFNFPANGRVHLGWLGLAFYGASLLFGDISRILH